MARIACPHCGNDHPNLREPMLWKDKPIVGMYICKVCGKTFTSDV